MVKKVTKSLKEPNGLVSGVKDAGAGGSQVSSE